MKVIIFNVEHGFCAFVRSPNGCGLMIDCGCTDTFSPVKFLLKYERDSLKPVIQGTKTYLLTKLIISHPHDDHVQDIENIIKHFEPSKLQRRGGFVWEEIKRAGSGKDYANLDMYSNWQTKYKGEAAPIDWGGMSVKVGPSLSIDQAKALGEADFVNNTSIPVFLEYGGIKFAFPGDLMESGWKKLLQDDSFRANLAGTNVFIASHHGHTSGFCAEAFKVMGNPNVCVISAHKRDESVDPRYSSSDFVKGIMLNGEPRYRLTTRYDGSIIFLYVNSQSWQIDLLNLAEKMNPPDNRGLF